MNTGYGQLKNIHERAVETHDANELRKIPSLLNDWGFKCRENDGELLWTNLSLPTSVGETITIGLRYKKQDGTLTEDVFELCEKDPNVVTPYYKGKYHVERPIVRSRWTVCARSEGSTCTPTGTRARTTASGAGTRGSSAWWPSTTPPRGRRRR